MIEKLKLAIHHAEQVAVALRSAVEALPDANAGINLYNQGVNDASDVVQQAREGEIDGDWRSVIYRIRALSITPEKKLVTDDTPAFIASYRETTHVNNFVPTEATNPKIIVTEEEIKPEDPPEVRAFKRREKQLGMVITKETGVTLKQENLIEEKVEETKPVMTDREALISYTEENGKASALEVLALCGAKKLSDIKDSKMFRELLGR